MDDTGGGESGIAGGEEFARFADLHDAAALQDEIEFVLAGVGVGRVLLSRLKGIQAGEERCSACEAVLSHFVGSKGSLCGDLPEKHTPPS